jgi:hypothetical protein
MVAGTRDSRQAHDHQLLAVGLVLVEPVVEGLQADFQEMGGPFLVAFAVVEGGEDFGSRPFPGLTPRFASRWASSR